MKNQTDMSWDNKNLSKKKKKLFIKGDEYVKN